MTSGQARLPIAPSVFPFAQAGASGAWISDLLPFTRKIVDDLAIVKTVHTEAINHEPGVIEINTGTSQPGRPAVGAWLSYGLGRESEDLPAFVVMTSRFFLERFGLDHERLVFSHQGLDEKLVGVGTVARPVTEILG